MLPEPEHVDLGIITRCIAPDAFENAASVEQTMCTDMDGGVFPVNIPSVKKYNSFFIRQVNTSLPVGIPCSDLMVSSGRRIRPAAAVRQEADRPSIESFLRNSEGRREGPFRPYMSEASCLLRQRFPLTHAEAHLFGAAGISGIAFGPRTFWLKASCSFQGTLSLPS
jgi:hypothetical protein